MQAITVVGWVDEVTSDGFRVWCEFGAGDAKTSFAVAFGSVPSTTKRMIRVGASVAVTGYVNESNGVTPTFVRVLR